MIKYIKGAKKLVDYPNTNSEVVIVGRSNVGKSSFINAVYSHKIAYVGKTAGKTRMLNFFDVDNKYTMVDVPGYGFANRSQKELIEFGEMMDEYFNNREELKLVVMLVDSRHKPTKDDIDMIEYLRYHRKKILVVANKADKLSYSQSLAAKKIIGDTLGLDKNAIITISSLKKTNIDKVKEAINNALSLNED